MDKGADENFVRILWGKCGGEELGRMEFEVLWLYLHQKSATKVQLCLSKDLTNNDTQIRLKIPMRNRIKVLGKEDVETMSQQIGSENDVAITISEKKRLNTFREKLASVSRKRLLKVFGKLDQDQSGYLSLEEFRRLVRVMDKEANEKFVRILWGKCGGEELGRMEFEVLWLYLHQKSATKEQFGLTRRAKSYAAGCYR